MNAFLRLIFLAILVCGCQWAVAQNGALLQAKAEQRAHPDSHEIYQKLHSLVADKKSATTFSEREKLRDLFEQYGIWSSETTYASGEVGNRITLWCHVVNENGTPIPNAKIHVYQTDADGYYSVTDASTGKMGEQDARLFAFVRSDTQGNVEIKTIRPASYPKKYKGRTIPAHIHFDIEAEGSATKKLQVVFEDDPVMDAYWLDWAKQADFPVVTLSGDAGRFEVRMKK